MSLRIKESSRLLAKQLCFFILLVPVSSVKSLSWQANREKQHFAFVVFAADYSMVQASTAYEHVCYYLWS